MFSFEEYSHVRVKKDGRTGVICDKFWDDAEKNYFYTVEYDLPKGDDLWERISFNPYRYDELELLDF